MYKQTNIGLLCCVGSGSKVAVSLGRGYIGVRTDTTQQSGQTPDREVEIKNITVYVSGYTETDTTGMLSAPNVWRFSVVADIVMFLICTSLSVVCPDCCVVSVLTPM